MVDEKLRRAAESVMGRKAPEDGDPGAKRRKTDASTTLGKLEDLSASVSVQYEYSAGPLLCKGCPGFLITCAFQKEKAAIKELLPVLDKYLCLAKQQILLTGTSKSRTKPPGAGLGADSGTLPTNTKPLSLSLVKLGGRGLMFARLKMAMETTDAAGTEGIPTRAVQKLLLDISSGIQARFRFCQRVLPVERTCTMDLAAIQSATQYGTSIFLQLRRGAEDSSTAGPDSSSQLTFAVRFQSHSKGAKATASSSSCAAPDKASVIQAIAGSVIAACQSITDPSVSLTNPDVSCILPDVALCTR